MWVCTACTLENENDAYLSCAVCGTTRGPENEAAEDSRDAADSLDAAEGCVDLQHLRDGHTSILAQVIQVETVGAAEGAGAGAR